jgi:hypothetical protein
MPPLLDSDSTLARALARLPSAQRAALEAELTQVRARAALSGASEETRRLAEALVVALGRPRDPVEP